MTIYLRYNLANSKTLDAAQTAAIQILKQEWVVYSNSIIPANVYATALFVKNSNTAIGGMSVDMASSILNDISPEIEVWCTAYTQIKNSTTIEEVQNVSWTWPKT